GHRRSRPVHVGHWLEEQALLPAHRPFHRGAVEAGLGRIGQPGQLRKAIDRQKTRVVAGVGVLSARVAESDDDFHEIQPFAACRRTYFLRALPPSSFSLRSFAPMTAGAVPSAETAAASAAVDAPPWATWATIASAPVTSFMSGRG